jgi:hypothetical protein
LQGKRRKVGSQHFVILELPYVKLGAIKSTSKAVDESGSGCLIETEISEDQKGMNQRRDICRLANQMKHERQYVW